MFPISRQDWRLQAACLIGNGGSDDRWDGEGGGSPQPQPHLPSFWRPSSPSAHCAGESVIHTHFLLATNSSQSRPVSCATKQNSILLFCSVVIDKHASCPVNKLHSQLLIVLSAPQPFTVTCLPVTASVHLTQSPIVLCRKKFLTGHFSLPPSPTPPPFWHVRSSGALHSLPE